MPRLHRLWNDRTSSRTFAISPASQRILLVLIVAVPSLLSSCSPRDFLTRRLAFDLITASQTFRAEEQFQFRPGIISDKDYKSADIVALQHRGWISATSVPCPAALGPAPCWDVLLTPAGVETFQALASPAALPAAVPLGSATPSITVPAVRRELISITDISRQGSVADVDFTWRWTALNEVGAALYPQTHYRATVAFRDYDDGWRVIEHSLHSGQPLDSALQNSEPAQ